MYVGHASAASGADPYDFDGSQVQVTFNGSASKTFDFNETGYSDHVYFDLSADKPIVVSAFVRCTAVRTVYASLRGQFGAYHYYKRNVDDAAGTNVFGYTGPINSAPFVFGILAPATYSTTTSTTTTSSTASTSSSTKTTSSGWTTTSSSTMSTTSTTYYVPDADIGFEHEDITWTFRHESVDSTFTHDTISSTWTEVVEVSDRKPALETIYKQPNESYPIYADYVDVLVTDEDLEIEECTVTVVDSAGTDVTTEMVQGLSVQDVTKLKTQLKPAGAVASSPYKITFKAVTSLDNTYEIDGKLRVVDL
jgi:hypothetical protein